MIFGAKIRVLGAETFIYLDTSRALDGILWEPTSDCTFVARSRVDLLHNHEYSSNHDWEIYFKASWGIRGPK